MVDAPELPGCAHAQSRCERKQVRLQRTRTKQPSGLHSVANIENQIFLNVYFGNSSRKTFEVESCWRTTQYIKTDCTIGGFIPSAGQYPHTETTPPPPLNRLFHHRHR